MISKVEDLKLTLDDVANRFTSTSPDINEWHYWLTYLLEGLELQAASLDPDHPDSYEAFLERFRDEIKSRLKKGAW